MKATIEIKALDTIIERIEWLEHKYEMLQQFFNNHTILLNHIENKMKDSEDKF